MTFGSDGIVTTPIGTDNDHSRAIAIQDDGRIVSAGTSFNGSDFDFALVRYNTDGSLDNSFDMDGRLTTQVGTSHDIAYAVAIQTDQKIVVAGRITIGDENAFALVRYNADGSLDNTFDTDGIVTTPDAAGTASSMAIQSDGKIVVAGYAHNGSNYDIALVRYNPDGSLDNTLDSDGIVTTSIGTVEDLAYSLVIQTDEKIVVAGYTDNVSSEDIALVRYNADGSLDFTFDTDGIVITPIGTSADFAHGMTQQSDGKLVVVGKSYSGSNYDIVAVRYNTDGSLDSSFDGDGIVKTPVGNGNDAANAVTVQSDGRIVVAGESTGGSGYDVTVLRYTENGSLDITFDADGIVRTSIGPGGDVANSMAMQSDGKIVVAGKSNDLPASDFAILRYNNSILVGLSTVTAENTEVNVYPNPFAAQTILKSEIALRNAVLTVHNAFGQVVNEMKNISGQQVSIFRQGLPTGIYFLQIMEDSKLTATHKLVITD